MKAGKIELRPGLSRLERLREADRNHQIMLNALLESERLWNASEQTMVNRLEACIAVATIFATFAKRSGVTAYATERMNDLFVGLDELFSGRHSDLLKPCPVPSNCPAASDLAQQGMAHACVEVLRGSGIGATQAREEVARYMLQQGYKKFSTHKLRTLGTSLTGAGSTEHPAFEFYVMAKGLFSMRLEGSRVVGQFHPDIARMAVKAVIAAARKRDHRS